MNQIEVERVSVQEAFNQWDRFFALEALVNEREGVPPREAIDATIYDLWKKVIPATNFGEVSLTKLVFGFEAKLSTAFESGEADEFLRQSVVKDAEYASIYLNKTDQELKGSEAVCRANHQPEFLQATVEQLTVFLTALEESNLPEVYKQTYRNSVIQWQRFCETAQHLAHSELTSSFYTPEKWNELIDVHKTQESGELTLVYESEAIALLETPATPPTFLTMGEALKQWRLSPEERSQLTVKDEDVEMPTVDVVILLNIGDRRLFGQNTSWHGEIVPSQTAIDTDAKTRIHKVPPTRVFTPDEVVYICPHEFAHAVSGENGRLQPCLQMQEGLEGYLETQEGIATIAEMVMGEPFGHERQRLFAARYLAVAMMMKTTTVDGKMQPLYTIQDVFTKLRSYGISSKQAASTVWRAIRGTSLQHQVTSIVLKNEHEDVVLRVAECFPKDSVYFGGMIKILDWFRNSMPVSPGMLSSATKNTVEFGRPTLARLGYALNQRNHAIYRSAEGISQIRNNFDALVDLGRNSLITLLNYLLVGKLKFEDFETWKADLNRSGLVDYRAAFQPQTE